MKKKTAALLLVLALLIGCVAGGTIAWLMDTTTPVVNTFTVGNIDIDLTEATKTNVTGGTEYSFKMVPGDTINKDPKVTVKANSEKCYLFVKLEKAKKFDSFLTYEMADGWTALTGNDGVYYRTVDLSTTDQEFYVLKNNQVQVKSDVTKTMMDGLSTAGNLTLTVTAYAHQYANGSGTFDATTAWAQVTGSASTT